MPWRTRALSALTATALVMIGAAGPARAAHAVQAAAEVAGAAPAQAAPPASAASSVVEGNPFLDASGYVDPDWSARATAAAAAGGDLEPAMATVARQPTAVWLDSIAAITEGRGLRGHLDAALAQQLAGGVPVVITLVLYNLPNRSCMRAPSGELTVADGGVETYRTGFIDPVTAVLADPAYQDLRIAVVLEPDSLGAEVLPFAPTVECDEFWQAGVYFDTIPYALTRLSEVPNVYTYLDATGSNQLGWPDSFAAAVNVITALGEQTPAGTASIDGIAVNVADYGPVQEPFLDIDMTVAGTSVRQSRFVDWNDHLEEQTFIDALHAALVTEGFPSSIGMLVDTSRNGWGGPDRPTATSTALDLNAFVDQSRVDRRALRFTWCNQAGAGLGELPRPAPSANVHAYGWIKPPGESDGHYTGEPDRLGDVRCDPTSEMPPIGGSSRPTNALPGAPPRGEWFDAAFTELVRNAYPPLP